MPKFRPNSGFARYRMAPGFAPIIVLLIVVLVAAGAYFLGTQKDIFQKPLTTPSPTVTADPTANWKTYVSDKWKFSIKYPETWTDKGPLSKMDPSSIYLESNERLGEEPERLSYYVWISETKNPNKLPFKEAATRGLSKEVKNSFEYTREKLGNYTIYKTESLPGRFGSLSVSFTQDESRYITVILTPYDIKNPILPKQDQYKSTFDQILSTFQFID